jgi:hypothetical protein
VSFFRARPGYTAGDVIEHLLSLYGGSNGHGSSNGHVATNGNGHLSSLNGHHANGNGASTNGNGVAHLPQVPAKVIA